MIGTSFIQNLFEKFVAIYLKMLRNEVVTLKDRNKLIQYLIPFKGTELGAYIEKTMNKYGTQLFNDYIIVYSIILFMYKTYSLNADKLDFLTDESRANEILKIKEMLDEDCKNGIISFEELTKHEEFSEKFIKDIYYFENTIYIIDNTNDLYVIGHNFKSVFATIKNYIDKPKFIAKDIQKISILGSMILFLDTSDSLYTMGQNENADIPFLQHRMINKPMVIMEDVKDVVCGKGHCIILTNKNKVYGFGINNDGQIFPENKSREIFKPEFMTEGKQIFAGEDFTLIVSENELLSFGSNISGQLGLKSQCGTDSGKIKLPINDVNISTNKIGKHVAITKHNGSVYAWGNNRQEQLVTDSFLAISTPTRLKTEPIVEVEIGAHNTVLITRSGSLIELGIKMINKIEKLENIIAVKTGENGGLALQSDGSVWIWGKDIIKGNSYFYAPTKIDIKID